MKLGTKWQSLIMTSVAILCLLQSSCSLIVGNVRPTYEKSKSYTIADLSKINPDWKRKGQSSSDSSALESTDITYQSNSTGSIISLNSSCGKLNREKPRSLRDLTAELLLGFDNLGPENERKIIIQGSPSLETTVESKENRDSLKIRTVVFQEEACVYDLIYVARSENFAKHDSDFSTFVDSIRFK